MATGTDSHTLEEARRRFSRPYDDMQFRSHTCSRTASGRDLLAPKASARHEPPASTKKIRNACWVTLSCLRDSTKIKTLMIYRSSRWPIMSHAPALNIEFIAIALQRSMHHLFPCDESDTICVVCMATYSLPAWSSTHLFPLS
jgi:hypothetical protein